MGQVEVADRTITISSRCNQAGASSVRSPRTCSSLKSETRARAPSAAQVQGSSKQNTKKSDSEASTPPKRYVLILFDH
jgi:hypothetical protein